MTMNMFNIQAAVRRFSTFRTLESQLAKCPVEKFRRGDLVQLIQASTSQADLDTSMKWILTLEHQGVKHAQVSFRAFVKKSLELESPGSIKSLIENPEFPLSTFPNGRAFRPLWHFLASRHKQQTSKELENNPQPQASLEAWLRLLIQEREFYRADVFASAAEMYLELGKMTQLNELLELARSKNMVNRGLMRRLERRSDIDFLQAQVHSQAS